MVIHIALVGRESGHIWNGLKEIIPVDKLFLLHSANDDYYKYADEAKKLKKEVEKRFCPTVLVKINPFEMTNISDAIDKIVHDEIKNSNYQLITQDFAVGVTGGTNIMASGATIAAMLTGTKAYYVHDSRKLKRKKYTESLPIPPINIIRSVTKSHQKILQTLEKGIFVYKKEKQQGVMRNTHLRDKLGLRTSTLNSALKTLEEKGYIERQRGVPITQEKSSIGQKSVKVDTILENEMLVKITALGKYQVKKASMQ